MKLKIFFCQFPNPWALRVSGMGGYTSKCEKKSKSLHPTVQAALPADGGERRTEKSVGIFLDISLTPPPWSGLLKFKVLSLRFTPIKRHVYKYHKQLYIIYSCKPNMYSLFRTIIGY